MYANSNSSSNSPRIESVETKQITPLSEVEEGKSFAWNDGSGFSWEAKTELNDFTLGQEDYPVESRFQCPLSGETMYDPVTLPCQHTFSKASLERHYADIPEGEHSCPICLAPVPSGQLSINRALAETMARYSNCEQFDDLEVC